MDDYSRFTDNALDQADEKLLIFTVSDEALEKAAGSTIGAQSYPQTCRATMCIRGAAVGADCRSYR